MKKFSPKRFDVFICYASQDKEVARIIANELKLHDLKIWFDDEQLELGDSLRESIEHGLVKSKYGVVIVSPNFFEKGWRQLELSALVQREVTSRKKIIIPIWHEVKEKYVAKFSPLLADKVAAKTSEGMSKVADKIIRTINKSKIKAAEPSTGKIDFVNLEFKEVFSAKLASLINLIKNNSYGREINDLIEIIIMLLKERIEKWDIPSVKFATEELFTKLYKYSEKKGFCELYFIFKDLFRYAHSQRMQLIASMIETFELILFGSWVPHYDVERGEKAAKVMLRLGIDFLDKDLDISLNSCAAIDNLAGDMFEPEILSKEILMGASAFEKIDENPTLEDFVELITNWIKIKDEYSWEGGTFTYLIDSIKYAKSEQKKYGVKISKFEKEYLLPALMGNIDKQIQEYVDFLGELVEEGKENHFSAELLAKMILAYKSLRPNITNEIKELVLKKRNQKIIDLFNKIIEKDYFLKKTSSKG